MSNMNLIQLTKETKGEQWNTLGLYDDISLQIRALNEFSRKIAVIQNELHSLGEFKDAIEKYIDSPLHLQGQIISLLKTEIGIVELRINEKSVLASQLHKQIKSNSGSIEMKDNKANSLKAKLNEIDKSKNDVKKKIKQLEDSITSNNTATVSQREKCDLLVKQNEELMIKIEQSTKANQFYNKENIKMKAYSEEVVNKELNGKINQMTLVIYQLENKKARIHNQIKQDRETVKEKKLNVLKDRLRIKKEKNNKLQSEQIKQESSIEELKEIFLAYSNQSKAIVNQLKSIKEDEVIIKKNIKRKEGIYSISSLIYNNANQ